LGLWARLVSSVPYVRMESNGTGTGSGAGSGSGSGSATVASGGGTGSPDVLLDQYVPKVVAAYIRGRVDSVTGISAGTACFIW
jgi:hypothetical protein